MASNKVFKIIKIIDEYRVVINAGANDSIEPSDKFEIYVEGNEVFDPDTNELLGTLDYVKATVEAVDIFPKMSICRNTEYTEKNLLGVNFTVQKLSPLNVETKDISGGFEDINKKIKVGDLVRKSLV